MVVRLGAVREKITLWAEPDLMAALLRFLSFVALLSLIFAIAVAMFLKVEAGFGDRSVTIASVAIVLALFTLPISGFYLWSRHSARRLEDLTARVRAVVGGEAPGDALTSEFGGELTDLARVLQEWDAQVAALHDRFDQSRALAIEILDSIGEGLLAIDKERRIVLANVRLAEIFELRPPLTGSRLLEVIRSAHLVEAFDKALAGEATVYRDSIEARGRKRMLEVRVFPVHKLSDAAAVALFIDISQIERLERTRREFVADFSHEVRTPMAGLRTAIESFEGGRLLPEQETQLREVILRQLGRLERLVRDLAELNEIESGGLELRFEVVDVRTLLVGLAEELFAAAPQGVSVQGDGVRIVADRLRVEQVFSNLIDNAVKYGGSAGPVKIAISTEHGEAVVRVSDAGPGIPASDLDRVFHRFYRVDRSRSQVAGSGLGLAITKHLVELHRGSITATSQIDKGSTFEVRLPLER